LPLAVMAECYYNLFSPVDPFTVYCAYYIYFRAIYIAIGYYYCILSLASSIFNNSPSRASLIGTGKLVVVAVWNKYPFFTLLFYPRTPPGPWVP
jgi:hypothetical protein